MATIVTVLVACYVSEAELFAAYDHDGDGHLPPIAGGNDCDNEDAAVHPDADELCGNDLDDDCDGRIDVDGADAPSWWPDFDGDGLGAGDPVSACARPADHVDNEADCDDTDASVQTYTWYMDADGDGFGDPNAPVEGCSGPPGTAPLGTDCDDTTAAVSPAADEICADGIDNDCSGDGEGCGLWGELDAAAAADQTLTGTPSEPIPYFLLPMAADWNQDGFSDLLYARGETFTGVEGGPRATYQLAGADFEGTGFGIVWSTFPDVDGDGILELLSAPSMMSPDSGLSELPVGTLLASSTRGTTFDPLDAATTFHAGLDEVPLDVSHATADCGSTPLALISAQDRAGNRASVYLAHASGANVSLSSATISVTRDRPYFGGDSASADLTGDGCEDLLLLERVNLFGTYPPTNTHLFEGPLAQGLSIDDALVELGGPGHATMGYSHVVADLDGDGQVDLAQGDPYGGPYILSGEVTILLGPIEPTSSVDEPFSRIQSTGVLGLGGDVDAGDLDADGDADLVVGGHLTLGPYSYYPNGALYVFHGPIQGGTVIAPDDADAVILGPLDASQTVFGQATAVGDFDGDGADDIVSATSANSGTMFLFWGVPL